jgi:hypothetical protein
MKRRVSKYDTRIFYDTKKKHFIRLKWDHAIDGVSKWWWTNGHDKSGYITGKLKPPKHWDLLGTVQEGYPW